MSMVMIVALVVGGSLVFGLVVFGVVWLLVWWIVKPPKITNGVDGEATIRAVTFAGAQFNGRKQLTLKVEVRAPYWEPYTSTVKVLRHRSDRASYQVGDVVPVLIDPDDKHLMRVTDATQREVFNLKAKDFLDG